MSTHLQLANSTTMAILCGITILIVLLQPVIFMIVAFKRGKELKHDRPGDEGSRTKQRDLLYYPVTPDHRELPALSSVPGPLFPVAPLKRCRFRGI